MKLNFSQFKKIKSDKDSTTLQHKDGHTINVIHNRLPKEHRDQLHSLPMASQEASKEKNAEPEAKASKKHMMSDGGKVSSKSDKGPAVDPQKAKEVQSGATQSGWQPAQWSKNVKEGLGLAEGGEVSESPAAEEASSKMPSKDEEINKIVSDAQKAETTPSDQPLSLDLTKPPQVNNPALINPNPGAQSALTNGSTTQLPTADQEAGTQPITAPDQKAAEQTVDQTQDQSFSPANGLAKEITGINAEAQAKSQQGKADANTLKQAADAQIQFAQDHQDNVAKLQGVQDQLNKEINDGHIDPNRLWHNMGTGQKISTIVGLLVSGIGAGLSRTENLAVKGLNQAIDRDIDAQKAELGKKENLLQANLRQFGNLKDAEEFTRITMDNQVINQLKQNAAKATSPMAKAQAMQVIGQKELENADRINKFGLKQSIQQSMKQGGGLSKLDPATIVSALVPEPHQKQVFGEIEAAQNTKRMGGDIMKAFDQAASGQTIGKRLGGLRGDDPSIGALHQALQPTFKDLEGTVRQAAMDNTFNNVSPKMGDLPSTIATKRHALEQYLKSKASAPTAKGFGIDLSQFDTTAPTEHTVDKTAGIDESKFSPREKQFLDFAKQNPSNPKSAIILKKLGIN